MAIAAIVALIMMFGKVLGPVLSFLLKIAFMVLGFVAGGIFFAGKACVQEYGMKKTITYAIIGFLPLIL
ncbi:hypothetical protein [Aquitalea palustris]|uniref:hypothetical protein n=1 Tax=Aquitalea palustris TaxID=2480983 RepID=UPI001CF003D4|nr:hypothetical protein [Aquitalea palustris]